MGVDREYLEFAAMKRSSAVSFDMLCLSHLTVADHKRSSLVLQLRMSSDRH